MSDLPLGWNNVVLTSEHYRQHFLDVISPWLTLRWEFFRKKYISRKAEMYSFWFAFYYSKEKKKLVYKRYRHVIKNNNSSGWNTFSRYYIYIYFFFLCSKVEGGKRHPARPPKKHALYKGTKECLKNKIIRFEWKRPLFVIIFTTYFFCLIFEMEIFE